MLQPFLAKHGIKTRVAILRSKDTFFCQDRCEGNTTWCSHKCWLLKSTRVTSLLLLGINVKPSFVQHHFISSNFTKIPLYVLIVLANMLLDEHSPLSLYIAIAILTGLQCIYFLYIYFARRQLASTLSVVLSIVALLTTVPLHFHHWLSHHPSTDAENSVLRFTLAIQSLVQIILEVF